MEYQRYGFRGGWRGGGIIKKTQFLEPLLQKHGNQVNKIKKSKGNQQFSIQGHPKQDAGNTFILILQTGNMESTLCIEEWREIVNKIWTRSYNIQNTLQTVN